MRKPKGYTAAATSPGKTPKGKSRELKPPDLWIHHDQMELKAMDKSNDVPQMTATPIQRHSQEITRHDDDLPMPPPSTIRKTTYGDSLYDDINKRSGLSPTDTSITLMSGTSTAQRRAAARGKPIIMSAAGDGQQISLEPSTGLSRPLYPRTQLNISSRAHVTLDSADGSGMSGVHHLYDPVAAPPLHMGIGQQSSVYSSSSAMPPQVIPIDGTSPMNKRPLGHPLKSFSVPAPPPPNPGMPTTPQPKHIGKC